MTRKSISVMLLVAAACAGALLVPVQAAAQVGGLFGKVLNEKGEPVAGAEVMFENKAAMMKVSGPKTNAKGEWAQAGLRGGVGSWSVEAKKDGISAGISGITVRVSAQTEVPDLVLRAAPKASIGAAAVGGGLDPEVAKARAKVITDVQKLYNAAVTAADGKNYDAAVATLTEAIGKMADCGLCYLKLGEVYTEKKDLAAAEKAYLKIVEIADKSTEAGQAYSALAAIYNQQGRYDEAQKASQKATELSGAGGDATSVFNAGVILVNQNKFPEAKVQFEQAVKLDPKMADAHYWLGMAYVNEGKMAEAKAEMTEYMKLAPTGQYADVAKELLK